MGQKVATHCAPVAVDGEKPDTDSWMRRSVLGIRDALLATEDTVCLERARLVREAYERFRDDPPALKRAKAFAHVLRTMTLDVKTNPFFAGNTSTRPRAWMLVPEYGFSEPPQIIHENPQLHGLLDGQIPQEMLDYWADHSFGGNSGIGHLAVDLDRVVHEGLAAIITEAETCAGLGTEDERVMRQAMVIALQAVIDWAGRYAEAAQAAAEQVIDPLARAAHLRVAEACRHVPSQPARGLFEGLQAIVLIHLALHIEGHGLSVSIGLPDRVLAPFVADGRDLVETTDLVAAFLLKITANSIFGRGSKTQPITVGGVDAAGVDQSNTVTSAFLEACDLVRVGDPHLFLRWHPNGNAAIKHRALEMLASGVSMPLLINDAPTVQGFVEAGVPASDAWDYCVIGCNELGIPGRASESATATSGLIQYLALLNDVLLSHDDPNAIASMGDLLDLLEVRMSEHALSKRVQGQAHRRSVAEKMPMPFTSALMHNCVARGQDFMVGMDYHNPSAYERGITNGVNALVAIERVVFEEQIVTLSELVEALRCNFEGYGALHARLRAAPKWGNGDARADAYAPVLLAMRERVLDAVDLRLHSAPHMVCHVVRSLHYFDGKHIAASPDGRLAWTPVADSIGAETGTAVMGPTGILNSALKLNPGHNYRGGTNLNLTLPASAWLRPEMQANLFSLVETHFAEGGQELQIAALDSATLRDAQVHPERHGDLLVRIAGFNARFVDLAPVEQAELIQRAEAVG